MSRACRSTAQWLTVLLLLPPLLVSCGGVPSTHYYVLESRPDADHGSAPAGRTGIDIGVRSFRVDPPYDQDRIIYRVREHSSEIGFYAYHRWASPLERMLPVVVAAQLEPTDGVRTIEPVIPGRSYDVILVGRLLSLEEIDHRDGQDVRVRLRLELRRSDGTELWGQTVSAVDTIRTEQVVDVVSAMNRVLTTAVAEARPGLSEAVVRVRDAASRAGDHSR